MPNKKVLIAHLQRKGFLGKNLEHCLRNKMRSMYPADPIFMHGSSKSQKFISLENFSVARFCGIFEDLKNPKFHLILKKDFLKIIFDCV